MGDPQQTLNYVEDVPEFVRKFGTESMLTYLVKLNPREVTSVELIQTYRSVQKLLDV